MNRYGRCWYRHLRSQPQLATFIPQRMPLVPLTLLTERNIGVLGEKKLPLEGIDTIFKQFPQEQILRTINIPIYLTTFCEKTGNHNAAGTNIRTVILVYHSYHIWGALFIQWKKKEKGIKRGRKRKNRQRRRYEIRANICSRARYFHPLNIRSCKVEQEIGGTDTKYINQLPTNYVRAVKEECKFDENKDHRIGFVWHHLKTFGGGDLGQLSNMYSISNSAKHPCLICLCSNDDIRNEPIPTQRCWKTRDYSYAHSEERSNTNLLLAHLKLGTEEMNINEEKLHSQTSISLYQFLPFLLSLPILHCKEGIAARIFYAMLKYVNKDATETPQDRLRLKRLMLNMLDKQDEVAELQAAIQLAEREHLDTNSKGYRTTLSLLAKAKRDCTLLKKDVTERVDNRKSEQGRKLSQLLMKHSIREYHPVENTMQGKSAENFIDHWKEFIPFFEDETLQLLFEGLMIRLEFIRTAMMKKNFVPYDKQVLQEMKQAVLEFDILYKEYLKKIDQIVNENNNNNNNNNNNKKRKRKRKEYKRFGNKIHYLYHALEWCGFYYFSPAWIDDQRCEQFNLRLRRYWNIFSSSFNEVNLLKMANTIVRKTQLSYGTNCNKTIKETTKLLNPFLDDYYKRRIPIEKETGLLNDVRYQRRSDYDQLDGNKNNQNYTRSTTPNSNSNSLPIAYKPSS